MSSNQFGDMKSTIPREETNSEQPADLDGFVDFDDNEIDTGSNDEEFYDDDDDDEEEEEEEEENTNHHQHHHH